LGSKWLSATSPNFPADRTQDPKLEVRGKLGPPRIELGISAELKQRDASEDAESLLCKSSVLTIVSPEWQIPNGTPFRALDYGPFGMIPNRILHGWHFNLIGWPVLSRKRLRHQHSKTFEENGKA
jgi:hypothetical protein